MLTLEAGKFILHLHIVKYQLLAPSYYAKIDILLQELTRTIIEDQTHRL